MKVNGVNSFLQNGWKLGRLSMSDETKQKLSDINKCKKLSKETRLKMSMAQKQRRTKDNDE